ncbi:MAG: hypothetical protein HKM23_09500 [Nitrosopumilus sp.]|nr:hypothetical protein [Nitrosopumilus sp.]
MKKTLLIFTIAVLSVFLISQASSDIFADVISPKKQIKIGIDQTEIICKANLVKVYRINSDSVDCFTPESAQKLVDMGLAQDIPKDKLEAKKSFRTNQPIGKVTGLATVKQFGSEGKLSTDPRVVDYLYVFDACANEKTIRLPEVLVTSDSEAKTVKLAKKILANTCYTSSTVIKTTDPASVSGVLTNKGLITDKITQLESAVTDLQQQLDTKKKSLGELTKSTTLSDETKKKVSDTTSEIVKLRAELNLAKGELNKYLYTLNAPQLTSSQFAKQKLSFTGVPLKDTSTSIMSISRQTVGNTDSPDTTSGLKLYNVVFEACAGNEVVRAPEVKITSDTEEKIIRVSERIIANSCQMSAGKINTVDINSIKLELANRSDISAKITQLEKNIEMLLDEQSTYQIQLNKLVVKSERPADFEQKVTEWSTKIIKLRNDIRDAKFQLYGSIYEIYKSP